MDRLADFRTAYAQMVVARGGRPHDERLLRVFGTVERHHFLGTGPWIVSEDGTVTGSDDPALVYQDVGIGLAPGVPTGLPSLHAALLGAADVEPGEIVMHVGAGSGYYSAILAELVGSGGRVYAYEINEALAARARSNVAGYPWLTVETRSGVCPPPEVVDLVYVNAGVQQVPVAWLEALSHHGRLLFPLVPGDGEGAVFRVTREPQGYSAAFVSRARFVPCIGTQDDEAQRRLAAAFRSTECEAVRSLRLRPDPPDGTAWFVGDGWWLSTAAR
ncbi:MAG TPA: hypothetical protein VMJ10_36760 [Kofleriaceae bacterium]|nr:hypothetical protein [Kofleriaceae bacterium]